MTWNDAEDIGYELYQNYPDKDPLDIRFTDLHRMVVSLPDFDDDPMDSNEKRLEAIQMAWLDEYRETPGT